MSKYLKETSYVIVFASILFFSFSYIIFDKNNNKSKRKIDTEIDQAIKQLNTEIDGVIKHLSKKDNGNVVFGNDNAKK